MGLDTVELVMAFEERFAISIPDEDAEKIVTVRDAIDYIYARVNHTDANVCMTQRSFHRLRRALQTELGIARSTIKPASRLSTIMRLEDRRVASERLRAAVGASSWPDLYRSRTTVMASAAGSVVVGATVWIAATSAARPLGSAFFLATAATLASAILMAHATQHLRRDFRKPATVGQLAEYLLAHETMRLEPNAGEGWSREQVRAVVRAIIVQHLNVEPHFSDDASFVDDLGAD